MLVAMRHILLLMDFFYYHQIWIAKQYHYKTNFSTKWGCYQYTVMSFHLKNVLANFSQIIIATFKEFINKFLEVYLDY